jgi:2-polyprenyl-3-methyl-5-hydroxy-6-metoxy-1,4-benzoquinol methylase
MPESEKAGVFFDRFAETFDTIYEGKRNRWMQWIDRKFRSDMYIRFQRTFDVFGDLTNKTVLDIGCGSGIYTVECLRRGARHATALDPAPGMLDLLRTRLQEVGWQDRCTLVTGLFPGTPLPEADHAIVMGVMDYIEDAAAFLRNLRPLVRQSAAISFPSQHWFRTPIRKFRYRLRNCPVYFYEESQVRKLGKQAGFTQVEVYPIPGAGMDFHVTFRP